MQFVVALSSCTEDSNLAVEMSTEIKVETHAQLLDYLNKKYGAVEELPITVILESGRSTLVPHKYRLPDDREISVDIIFTADGSRVLDSNFDLSSLPR